MTLKYLVKLSPQEWKNLMDAVVEMHRRAEWYRGKDSAEYKKYQKLLEAVYAYKTEAD